MHSADPLLVERYYDHGATSFPKPESVGLAMIAFIDGVGGTYGRSAYTQAQDASRLIFETRERLARLVGASDSSRVVFTLNATHALNIAIQSFARDGGKVLVSPLEHNAVMRPLEMMAGRTGLEIETLPHSPADGLIDPARIEVGADVKLVVVCHQSNVNGVIQPIREIKDRIGGVPLLVDGAQSVGEVDVNVVRDGMDMLAMPCHKHLLGPTGVGALYVGAHVDLAPLMPGGTGSKSESLEHPMVMPDRLEGGTPNLAGIAGLNGALKFIEERGIEPRGSWVVEVASRLESAGGITVYRAANASAQGGLFSFAIDGLSSSEVAHGLYREAGIAVRSGLHCAPSAHRSLGTLEIGGTVRAGFGRFHDDSSVGRLVDAVLSLSHRS